MLEFDLDRRARKLERMATVAQWWHSIDLGDGVVTPGHKSAALLRAELAALRLPVLAGKTVLDIGAWDGFFSFAAERRGAHVVALDYHMWRVDPSKAVATDVAAIYEGRARRHWEDGGSLFSDELRGKRGFDTAHGILGSHVESVVADFTALDPDSLGVFDVVLFLGVLYHLRHPLTALERLRSMTREVAVIESHANYWPGREHRAICEFLEGDELNQDHENWWAPNLAAIVALCRAAGFRKVSVCAGPPASVARLLPGSPAAGYRATVHAYV